MGMSRPCEPEQDPSILPQLQWEWGNEGDRTAGTELGLARWAQCQLTCHT